MLSKALAAAAALFVAGQTIFAQTPSGVGDFTIQSAFDIESAEAPSDLLRFSPNRPVRSV